MRNPPNSYVLLGLGAIGAFFVMPIMRRKLEAKNMSLTKAGIISFFLMVVLMILSLAILETLFGI